MGWIHALSIRIQRRLRQPRAVARLPARFRTTEPQALRELWIWVRDQFDPESRGFDERFGVATRWFDLGNYEPTPPTVVHDILQCVPNPEQLDFFDLGSGKGRVVLIAAGYPFRSVTGIERRRRLHRRALVNRSRYTGPRRAPMHFVHADVSAVTLPGTSLFVFLYNPFVPQVLEAFLQRHIGRDLWIASVNPIPAFWFQSRGFTVVEHHDHVHDDRRWTLLFRDKSQTPLDDNPVTPMETPDPPKYGRSGDW